MRSLQRNGHSAVAKRALDIVVSITALILLAPVLVGLALSIAADSGLPILYRQRRIGRDCVPFEILKFRTMVVGADRGGNFRTSRADPRVTRVGRILRRTSLDELPQFVNVLRGQMSLVGPRPDVPQQETDYSSEEWQLRHSVRPGITGPSQALLRSNATPAQRKALDLEYASHHGLLSDLRILGATLIQVLTRGGF